MTINSLPFRTRNTAPHGNRPGTAAELTPEGVLAATLATPGQPPVHAFAPIPAGALVPGIAESNVHNAAGVSDALRTALDQVAPRKKVITLVVPDTSARVFMLDFDTLPAKPAEALPVLRFRLRKMVPFDVEHAAVSYQLLSANGTSERDGAVRVLATVMPGAILAEYESAVRAAGYEPGVVLPSSLAALAALDSAAPALTANLSSAGLTTTITDGDDLLLYRTIELPADNAARVAEVQRSIAVAAAWYEDHLSAAPRELYYSGAVDAREFARAIADTNLSVREVAPPPAIGAVTTAGPIGFAGITGALAGAA